MSGDLGVKCLRVMLFRCQKVKGLRVNEFRGYGLWVEGQALRGYEIRVYGVQGFQVSG